MKELVDLLKKDANEEQVFNAICRFQGIQNLERGCKFFVSGLPESRRQIFRRASLRFTAIRNGKESNLRTKTL